MDKQHIYSTFGHSQPGPAFGILALRLCLFFMVMVLPGCAATKDAMSGREVPDVMTLSANCKSEQQLGICIEGLRLSAAGNMLDFRYRVSDPEKASPLFDRKVRPYLLDEISGAAFGVPETPKLGQLRTTRRNNDSQTDRDYHMLFANPGHLLQSGQKVSLVIGDVKLENIVVQ